MVYAVAPDSPIKSFQDLLDRARAAPGQLTYTITAHGSIYHVLTKWIEQESGTSMNPIPYRGSAQALQDILGGRVDVMVDAATSMFPRIKSGQLRVLALSSAGRLPPMPAAPTVAQVLPPPRGGGGTGGGVPLCTAVAATPLPTPPPQGGRELTEFAALSSLKTKTCHDPLRQIRLRRVDPGLGPLSRPASLAGFARDLPS